MLILIYIIPLILFIGIPVTIASIIAFKMIKEKIANSRMDVTTTTVRVSSIKIHRNYGSSPLSLSSHYMITFLFPDSRYQEMLVPRLRHDWLYAGIDVLLTHQGTKFIKVEPLTENEWLQND